ncbi:SIMPL domain-containing protein [Metabacillus halosaccharovorans]|uniref:SIMPL domain-containing protein n=1 Tax=Metabacillus halosaccharovorans TaxID=930124 RepID=A0ABT3DGE2_9BACI|nr:SIMPL domain-containing protein [Metabacillus halosaccharovorans]MCV9885931.1 SIMPL domain-containing protein [Metabacillus halosaccharovorans]
MSYYTPHYFQSPVSMTRMTSTERGRLTVEGNGKITATPDQAIIQIGIVTESKDAESAQSQNALISNNVISSLKKISISSDDINTISYTIQPVYEFTEGASILTGYRVQHILEITVNDLEKLGSVFEAAVAAGANIAENIRFDVSTREILYQQALQQAMKNATEKAIKLGEQIGVLINNIPVKVTEISGTLSPRPLSMAFSTESISQGAPPIQSNKIEIEAKVLAVFQY